jgi:hypothetical protein
MIEKIVSWCLMITIIGSFLVVLDIDIQVRKHRGDMNGDGLLNLKDMSILAAQINDSHN